jgi:hypothetical protein
MSIAAFEGSMDAHVATRQAHGHLMGSLAASEAARALGSAAAVATLPALVGARAIAVFAAAACAVLLAVTLLGVAAHAWARSTAWRLPDAMTGDWPWALRRSRRHRGRPLRWAAGVLLLASVGAAVLQVGQTVR